MANIEQNNLVENLYPKENRLLSPGNSRFRNIGEASSPTNKGLESSPLMVAVIIPITYNHMVEKMDAHEVTCLFEGLGQSIIKLARMDVSAWMVVDESQYSGIVQDGLLDNHPHVHAHFRQSALADPHFLDEFEVLAQQKDVCFLDGQILQDRTHVVIDGRCRGDVGAKSHGGELAALAQFDGGHNLADGVGAHALNLFEFVESGLSQLGEVAVVPFEDGLCYSVRHTIRTPSL